MDDYSHDFLIENTAGYANLLDGSSCSPQLQQAKYHYTTCSQQQRRYTADEDDSNFLNDVYG